MGITSKSTNLDTIDKIVDQMFKHEYFTKINNINELSGLNAGNRQEILGWFNEPLKWGYCIILSFQSCYHCYRRNTSICTCKAFVEES